MPNKHPAWCPGCKSRHLDGDDQPCAGCGFPSFWPHQYPNCYVPDEKEAKGPEPVALEEVPAPILSDEVMEEMDRIMEGAEQEVSDTTVSSTASTEVVSVQQTSEPEPETASESIEKEQKYHCGKCGHSHYFASRVGTEHLEYRE